MAALRLGDRARTVAQRLLPKGDEAMKAHPVWISSRDVGEMLGCDYKTVRKIKPSELPYWRANDRGDRKYDREDVLAYIERRMVR